MGKEDYRRLGKLAAVFQRLIQRLIKSKRNHLLERQSGERFILVGKGLPVVSLSRGSLSSQGEAVALG